MDDDARLGRKLLCRDAEASRGILDEHAPHLGAEHPQVLEIARHRVATGSVHHAAETRIAVDGIERRGGHHTHPRPVGIELFGNDQWQ